MTIPDEVSALLRGVPEIGACEQAFPFLSVDADGFPHSALLSRSELEPAAGGDTLLAAVASSRTRANLLRSGTAALLAVDGTVCHHIKLKLVTSIVVDNVLGCEFALAEHKRDDIGITMQPLTFRTTADLVEQENWARSAAIFDRLEAARAVRKGE
ncbi:MAG: hypothetical protein JWN03_1567 [Nocardia sp.]|uniref:hypothetical protein n=1 Tax=Nocardia sp. TaxID=1821 RepID=UPI00261CA426|nr:hypothetical protein [Nocardia sp.]MCU1641292.1 hypothetical protein [Nocardia sp.]